MRNRAYRRHHRERMVNRLIRRFRWIYKRSTPDEILLTALKLADNRQYCRCFGCTDFGETSVKDRRLQDLEREAQQEAFLYRE